MVLTSNSRRHAGGTSRGEVHTAITTLAISSGRAYLSLPILISQCHTENPGCVVLPAQQKLPDEGFPSVFVDTPERSFSMGTTVKPLL